MPNGKTQIPPMPARVAVADAVVSAEDSAAVGGAGGAGAGGGGGGGAGGQAAAAPRASTAPPVQRRFRLTNHGDKRVDVEVLDFNSALGNFAVQPAKITVPPHESAEADPMTSRLGVPAVEEIPLTVRLRT